jgi:hypothetical protein
LKKKDFKGLLLSMTKLGSPPAKITGKLYNLYS